MTYVLIVEVPRDLVGVVMKHPGIRVLFGPRRDTGGYGLAPGERGGDTGAVLPMLLTYKRAAEVLCISPSKVKQLVASGELRTVAIGASKRVPVSEVERFVTDRLEAEAS
jgi:excisionase family DNA binding protein